MTPRSLFVIIIKVLGLFMLKDIVYDCSQLVFQIIKALNESYEVYVVVLPTAMNLVLNLAIFYLFVFRPGVLIDKMRLGKHFYEEQFTMTMDKLLVLQICIVTAGLLLLAQSIPDLIKYLVGYYQSASYSNPRYDGPNFNANNIAFSIVKIIIAYLMMSNGGYLAGAIAGKNEQTQE